MSLVSVTIGGGGWAMMWVRGHSGIKGDEEADQRVKETGWVHRQLILKA